MALTTSQRRSNISRALSRVRRAHGGTTGGVSGSARVKGYSGGRRSNRITFTDATGKVVNIDRGSKSTQEAMEEHNVKVISTGQTQRAQAKIGEIVKTEEKGGEITYFGKGGQKYTFPVGQLSYKGTPSGGIQRGREVVITEAPGIVKTFKSGEDAKQYYKQRGVVVASIQKRQEDKRRKLSQSIPKLDVKKIISERGEGKSEKMSLYTPEPLSLYTPSKKDKEVTKIQRVLAEPVKTEAFPISKKEQIMSFASPEDLGEKSSPLTKNLARRLSDFNTRVQIFRSAPFWQRDDKKGKQLDVEGQQLQSILYKTAPKVSSNIITKTSDTKAPVTSVASLINILQQKKKDDSPRVDTIRRDTVMTALEKPEDDLSPRIDTTPKFWTDTKKINLELKRLRTVVEEKNDDYLNRIQKKVRDTDLEAEKIYGTQKLIETKKEYLDDLKEQKVPSEQIEMAKKDYDYWRNKNKIQGGLNKYELANQILASKEYRSEEEVNKLEQERQKLINLGQNVEEKNAEVQNLLNKRESNLSKYQQAVKQVRESDILYKKGEEYKDISEEAKFFKGAVAADLLSKIGSVGIGVDKTIRNIGKFAVVEPARAKKRELEKGEYYNTLSLLPGYYQGKGIYDSSLPEGGRFDPEAATGAVDFALLAAGPIAETTGLGGGTAMKFASPTVKGKLLRYGTYGLTGGLIAGPDIYKAATGQQSWDRASSEIAEKVGKVGTVVSASSAIMNPPIRYETLKLTTPQGENVLWKGFTTRYKVPWKQEFSGSPLVGSVKTETVTRGGAALKVVRDASGKFTKVGTGAPESRIVFGTPRLPLKSGFTPQQYVVIGDTKHYVEGGKVLIGNKKYNVDYNTLRQSKNSLNPEVKIGGRYYEISSEGFQEYSPAINKLLEKSLKPVMSKTEYVKAYAPGYGAKDITATTYRTKYEVKPEVYPKQTEHLKEGSVEEVLKVTKKNTGGFSFGSAPTKGQVTTETYKKYLAGKKPADVDIMLPVHQKKAEKITKQLVENIKARGDKVYISSQEPTLIVKNVGGKEVHVVDVKHLDTEISAAPGVFNVPYTGRQISTAGQPTLTLGEQAARKTGSVFTVRRVGDNFYWSPESHRGKDIATMFMAQEGAIRNLPSGPTKIAALNKLEKLKQLFPSSLTRPVVQPSYIPFKSQQQTLSFIGPESASSQQIESVLSSKILKGLSYSPSSSLYEYYPSSISSLSPYTSTPPSPYTSTPPSPYTSTPPSTSPSTPPSPYTSTPPSTSPSTPPSTPPSTSPSTPPSTSPSTSPSPFSPIYGGGFGIGVFGGFLPKGYTGGNFRRAVNEWTVVNPLRDLPGEFGIGPTAGQYGRTLPGGFVVPPKRPPTGYERASNAVNKMLGGVKALNTQRASSVVGSRLGKVNFKGKI